MTNLRLAPAISLLIVFLVNYSNGAETEGVQIVNYDSDANEWHFFTERLEEILTPDIAELPLAIISVTGERRSGKSLLLNYMTRYLAADEAGEGMESWMGEADAPAAAFVSKPGATDTTMGIWIYPHIFKVVRNEREIAVLLIDSEGLFGSSQGMSKSARIYSMSSILSSVTIYNFKSDIDSQDLTNLAFFELTGRSAVAAPGGRRAAKPFQKLVFLCRDWEWPDEREHGWSPLWYNNKFRVGARDAEDVRNSKLSIIKSYDDITAYLMPEPGANLKVRGYDGHHGAFSDAFRTHFKAFIEDSFRELAIKKANGREVNSEAFLETFKYIANADFTEPPSLRDSFINMISHQLGKDIERDVLPVVMQKIAANLFDARTWKNEILNSIVEKVKVGFADFQEDEVKTFADAIVENWKSLLQERINTAVKSELRLFRENIESEFDAETNRLRRNKELLERFSVRATLVH